MGMTGGANSYITKRKRKTRFSFTCFKVSHQRKGAGALHHTSVAPRYDDTQMSIVFAAKI